VTEQTSHPDAVLTFRDAAVRFGERTLWSGLDLTLRRGEFVAILGPNGSGKTSLLRAVLGELPLSSGSLTFLGRPARHGNRRIGYIPQQRIADRGAPVRARELVGFGLDGHRFGLPLPHRAKRARVAEALEAVGAGDWAKRSIGTMSGGEQQRVRIAQALVGRPDLLLADEPLSSLDLLHQRGVSQLLDRSRRDQDLGLLMITHDINPVLAMVDRVVYIAAGQVRVGPVSEVLTTEVLSDLYRTAVEVLRVQGRIVVAGVPQDEASGHLGADDHHEPAPL
jgi:zinc/manganese transport system ATP-binding protein